MIYGKEAAELEGAMDHHYHFYPCLVDAMRDAVLSLDQGAYKATEAKRILEKSLISAGEDI